MQLSMARFKVFFYLSLHVLFLVTSSGTRSSYPFSIADPVSKTELKDHDQLALAVTAGEGQTKVSIVESKRALIEKAREAIKASIQRNGGIPFESKRLSPGGPDPHHHH
ncbi:hypothetical protein V6N13_129132 [Hibiscus sabdariffa]